ncbi:MAG: phosphatase PAP2 family protein [Acidimicrobiales bacterium]
MAQPHPKAFVPAGRRWSYLDTLRTAGALAVLVAGGLVASHGVPSVEASIFEAINQLPDAFYPVVWPVMQLGSVLVALAVALVAGWRTRRLSVAVCTVAAVGATWFVAKWVKHLVGRDRPFGVGLEVHLRDHATYGLGYVSGHAAVVAALYTMITPHLRRRYRPIAAALAVVVCFARIYSGAHLPLDVVGGAALGMLVGEAFRLLEVRWRSGRAPRAEDLVAPEPDVVRR